jgi:hypothetical protein
MSVKYTNFYYHFSLQDPPKFTQIWIFGNTIWQPWLEEEDLCQISVSKYPTVFFVTLRVARGQFGTNHSHQPFFRHPLADINRKHSFLSLPRFYN